MSDPPPLAPGGSPDGGLHDPRSHASAPPHPPGAPGPAPAGGASPSGPQSGPGGANDAGGPPAGGTAAPGRSSPWKPARSSWIAITAFALVIVAGVLVILSAWRLPPFSTPMQRTEDAYVIGRTTVISPQVGGYVWRVPVEDFARASRGEVLVVIDPRSYQQAVEQARADLDVRLTNLSNNAQTLNRARADVASQEAAVASARALLARADSDVRRSSDLVRDGAVSARENDQNIATQRQARASVDQARAARESAVQQVRSTQVNGAALAAQVEQARAQLHSAELDLERTVIRAPVDGQLSEVGVRVGQYVAAGTQLFFLVPPELWVTANYKEAQTRRMALGQPVEFTVDALGHARLRGHVDRIAPAASSQFAVLRPDNATGNFTKVPQRISARILVDRGQPLAARLKPGMSVEAEVDTTGGPGPR